MSLVAEHRWSSINLCQYCCFDKYKNVRYKTQIRPLLVKINDSVIIQEPCGSASLLATTEAIKLSGPGSLFSSFFPFWSPKVTVMFGTTPCPAYWGWKSSQMILARVWINSKHNVTQFWTSSILSRQVTSFVRRRHLPVNRCQHSNSQGTNLQRYICSLYFIFEELGALRSYDTGHDCRGANLYSNWNNWTCST